MGNTDVSASVPAAPRAACRVPRAVCHGPRAGQTEVHLHVAEQHDLASLGESEFLLMNAVSPKLVFKLCIKLSTFSFQWSSVK